MARMDLEANIGTVVEAAAARFGARKFLTVDQEGVTYSFADLNAQVNQFANALKQAGVERGTHVSVMLPNCSEFPLTWLALAKLGAVMVPVNNRYQVRDLGYILGDSDSTALVIHSDYLPIFRKVPPENHKIQKVFRIGAGEGAGEIDLRLSAAKMPAQLSLRPPALEDLMNLQYTSGTTGFPKAAITTHEYWLVLGKYAAQTMTPEDVFLTLSPFYYMDPQWELLMGLYSGCGIVLVDKISPENLARCIQQYPITASWAFPEMLHLADAIDTKNLHLKFALLSAFPPALHKEFEDRFHLTAREVYGMTEIGVGTQVPLEDTHMVGSGSVGKPPAFRELRIVDNTGKDVLRGQMGELLVKGQGIFQGYYKKPQENAKSFLGEYFRTGDLFRQDEKGNYYFVSRKKDMIRRMGDNISAIEVEQVLMSHPKIAEAAVVPVPDEVRGEEVKAYILPPAGETPQKIPPEEIVSFCLERIAKFKVPRYIEYVREFPKSASDKIQKNILISQKADLTQGCYDRFGKNQS
ncbi:MAG: AMP-binding protein [Anaerolineales bacterium]